MDQNTESAPRMRLSTVFTIGLFIVLGFMLKKEIADGMIARKDLNVILAQMDTKLSKMNERIDRLQAYDDRVMGLLDAQDAEIEHLNDELMPYDEWVRKIMRKKCEATPYAGGCGASP